MGKSEGTEDWKVVAERTRADRDSRIPAEWKLTKEELDTCGKHGGLKLIESKLSERELELTRLTASEAVRKLASGEISSLEITKAICHRAALAHQVTNCLTEVFTDEALARAAELDAAFKANGNKPTGPLHGLPVSVKDDVDIKGKRTTWGIVAWAEKRPASNSAIADILLGAGAVLYVKTNIPQDLMTWESDNFLWGHVMNVHNRDMGAGGSSGGEGCIMSCGASYLGVGSDIGGSIRIPAAVNGVYGLRPSAYRLAYVGETAIMQGSPLIIKPVNGPFGRSVEDVELLTKLWVEKGPEMDSEAVPIPWRKVELPAKLRLGYFVDTDMLRVTPPVRRAMEETVAALKAAGHELVEFPMEDMAGMYDLAVRVFGAYDDDLYEIISKSGEPLIDAMSWLTDREKPKATVGDLWRYQSARDKFRQKYHRILRSLNLDAVICPATALPSTPHHKGGDNIQACGYTMAFNVLDWTAGVVPCTAVRETDVVEAGFAPKEGLEALMWGSYSPQAMLHTPVSIQVVGGRLDEEKVLAVMKVVDEAIKSSRK
ncbi:amidase signature domain-containing protein [Hyaloraphidium curvatum]|nr:amidase signature domain-containing protein [Hyaloraphidium curvatum]